MESERRVVDIVLESQPGKFELIGGSEFDTTAFRSDQTPATMEIFYDYPKDGSTDCSYIFRWPTSVDQTDIEDIFIELGENNPGSIYESTSGGEDSGDSQTFYSDPAVKPKPYDYARSTNLEEVLLPDCREIKIEAPNFTIYWQQLPWGDKPWALAIIAHSDTDLDSDWVQDILKRTNRECSPEVEKTTTEFANAVRSYAIMAEPYSAD